MAEQFIGAGWAFPLRTDATGSIALVAREREIDESIRLILGTTPGERPMRPEFGCAVVDQVFAGADATTAGRIAYEVRRSLDRWEPRVEVVDVAIAFENGDTGTIYIDVRYVIRGTNDPRNLVFPFYLIPEEDPATVPALEPSRAGAASAWPGVEPWPAPLPTAAGGGS
ncbi:MAG TPA: GPW/gp25 family protein [Mycobacteriales bacterium]|nr:GPW/gp25 family protein [Mycobacteriales bacterium]